MIILLVVEALWERDSSASVTVDLGLERFILCVCDTGYSRVTSVLSVPLLPHGAACAMLCGSEASQRCAAQNKCPFPRGVVSFGAGAGAVSRGPRAGLGAVAAGRLQVAVPPEGRAGAGTGGQGSSWSIGAKLPFLC